MESIGIIANMTLISLQSKWSFVVDIEFFRSKIHSGEDDDSKII
jgi:hypothetical protein